MGGFAPLAKLRGAWGRVARIGEYLPHRRVITGWPREAGFGGAASASIPHYAPMRFKQILKHPHMLRFGYPSMVVGAAGLALLSRHARLQGNVRVGKTHMSGKFIGSQMFKPGERVSGAQFLTQLSRPGLRSGFAAKGGVRSDHVIVEGAKGYGYIQSRPVSGRLAGSFKLKKVKAE